LFKGYGAKVGLGNMRVKAENRMVTHKLLCLDNHQLYGVCCDINPQIVEVIGPQNEEPLS
jgi:hypothetical protein